MSARGVATTIYDYWLNPTEPGDSIQKPAFSHLVAVCVIGNQEGEYSLEWPPGIGDGGKAFGIGQWHKERADIIEAKTGIDVRTAGVRDQNRAMWWELKNIQKRALTELVNAKNLTEGVSALVKHFEYSGNKDRDIVRRTQYAGYWDAYFRDR